MKVPDGVALVQAAIDAYNRRDVAELRELMTEHVQLRPPVSALTGRAYLGHDGIAEWLHDVDESFATAEIVPLELRDLGGKVLALTEFVVEGYESRVPLGSELGLVCDLAEGRIASWLGFFSHAEARAAAT
ncbi:MAG TPA: nuclear transport factor 2 family protein [Beijerinckiaceae bacterium]|jgi:ketosteroid isomerase-like protein|nr:nuclear transport factor 2 family protein [Beijerinckiaceae bacterium]